MVPRVGCGFDVASYGLLTPFAETVLAAVGSGSAPGSRRRTRRLAWSLRASAMPGGVGGPEHALRLDFRLRI
ncbi:MAG: hypothetical protein OXD40_09830 [bacterium]|nr:hypothetical protein [bacterium]